MIVDNLTHLNIVAIEQLTLNRTAFSCESEALTRYFHCFATQDVKKGLAKCFVLIDQKQSAIIGFYTLSALSISLADLSPAQVKGVPYPLIPAALLGRLAIDSRFARQGYGKFLIVDAIHKIKQTALAAALLVVDAKDDNALAFYRKLGFIEFRQSTGAMRKLFYPLTKIIKSANSLTST